MNNELTCKEENNILQIEEVKHVYEVRQGSQGWRFKLLTVISNCNDKGFVKVVDGHYSKEDIENMIPINTMQKHESKLIAKEQLTEKQLKKLAEYEELKSQIDEKSSWINRYFHSIKDKSATQNDVRKFDKLDREIDKLREKMFTLSF